MAAKKKKKPAAKRDPDPPEEQIVARSAVTGRFVTLKYALRHPWTTVKERWGD